MLYRFTPRALRSTDCEITWLVNETAPSRAADYDRSELTWLWDVTTIADKTIIERNQAGRRLALLRARAAVAVMEDFTRQFLHWYVAIMRETWPPSAGSPGNGHGLQRQRCFAAAMIDG